MAINNIVKFLVLPILLVFGGCKFEPQVKEHIQKWENGNLKRKYQAVGDIIQDTMYEYYPSGKLRKVTYFKDNKEQGRAVIYFESGELQEVLYYKDGLKEGGDTVYYPNGKLHFTTFFKDDKKNGPFQRWGMNDSLEFEAVYEMDKLIGIKEYIKQVK